MDWLNEAWRFIESEDNQKALAFIGAGIAVAGAAVWQVYTHFVSPGSTAEPRTVTADGGGFASSGDIHFTQSSPGPLVVGGVHGIRPEDFQRVSEELGVTNSRTGELLQGPGQAGGRARGPRQHPARLRQAL